MAKKEVNATTPQSDIDLNFWQYVQGVKDVAINAAWDMETKIKTINFFIQEKFKHIEETHRKTPSFTLKAEMIMGRIEIKKKLI